MPRNFGAPSHTSITETALGGPWRPKLEPLLRPSPVAAAGVLLRPAGAAARRASTSGRPSTCRCSTAPNPVKEWTKGTWLTPLLAALDEPERSRFEAAYGERVAAAYPPRARRQDAVPVPPHVPDRDGALTRGTPGAQSMIALGRTTFVTPAKAGVQGER